MHVPHKQQQPRDSGLKCRAPSLHLQHSAHAKPFSHAKTNARILRCAALCRGRQRRNRQQQQQQQAGAAVGVQRASVPLQPLPPRPTLPPTRPPTPASHLAPHLRRVWEVWGAPGPPLPLAPPPSRGLGRRFTRPLMWPLPPARSRVRLGGEGKGSKVGYAGMSLHSTVCRVCHWGNRVYSDKR